MSSTLEISKLKLQIRENYTLLSTSISKMDKIYHSHEDYHPMDYHFVEEQIESETEKFCFTFKKLYFLCIEFFEKNNSNEILKIFKHSYNIIFDNSFQLIKLEYVDIYEDYFYTCQLFHNLQLLLEPFDIIKQKDILSNQYLENLLKNTGYLIKELQQNSGKEVEVYTCIKTIIKSIFSDSRFVVESFVTTAKSYKPDILIPSLRTCIEYKFAKSEKRLIDTIGEIYEDIHGYSTNSNFEYFYVVFYLKDITFPINRFNEIIYEKHFPKNWKFFLINSN